MIICHGNPRRLFVRGKLSLRGIRLDTEPFRIHTEKRKVDLEPGVVLYPVYPLSEFAGYDPEEMRRALRKVV